jgi:hypothetical protein
MEAHQLPVIQRAQTSACRMYRAQTGTGTRLPAASLTGFYPCH